MTKLDRLGRSLEHLIDLSKDLQARGVDLVVWEMYEETGPDSTRRYTVAQIAAEFGVTRPTIYRHLESLAST